MTVPAGEAAVMPTYARYPLTLVRGERLTVWDDEGTPYVPFADFHDVRVNGLVTPSRGVMDLPLPAGALHHSPRSAHD